MIKVSAKTRANIQAKSRINNENLNGKTITLTVKEGRKRIHTPHKQQNHFTHGVVPPR
jgi:uncharacterized protein Veg